MRLFAIPDIHGRYDLLIKLWDKLMTNHSLDLSTDKVVFLGDMVDRGPDSRLVIDFIKDLTEKHPNNVIALAGNHEWMCIMAHVRATDSDVDLFENNGGVQTLESYAQIGLTGVSGDHLKWMSSLPLKHEEPGFFFSHAPAPRESWRRIINHGQPFTPEELTWTYHSDEFGVARDFGNGIIGVCGHIHKLRDGVMKPRFYDHYYFLDSGCGCSMKAPLVAVEVNTKEVVYAWPPQKPK